MSKKRGRNPTSPAWKNKPVLATATDDSGTVISLSEYAELHGEPHQGSSTRLGSGPAIQTHETSHTFEEIARIRQKIPGQRSVPRSSKQRESIKCKYCGKQIGRKDIYSHDAEYHPEHLRFRQETTVTKTIERIEKKNREEPWLAPEGKEGNIAETFRQALNESRDGSKGLGHMRRESDGKFGSFPLHDNYSDESDSK